MSRRSVAIERKVGQSKATKREEALASVAPYRAAQLARVASRETASRDRIAKRGAA